MKIKDIRKKKNQDLLKELEKSRRKLKNFRFDLVTKKLKNYSEISQVKRKIANILTVLSERKRETIEKMIEEEKEKLENNKV